MNNKVYEKTIYEIVPGFLVNMFCLYILEKFNKK